MKIVYSPGYGAGWQTWNTGLTEDQQYRMVAHPEIVRMVEDGEFGTSEKENPKVREIIGVDSGTDVCWLGCDKLAVIEVPDGCRFWINEYDGSESVQTESMGGCFIATPIN